MGKITPNVEVNNDNMIEQFRAAHEIRTRIANSSDSELKVDLSDAEWFVPAFLAPMSVVSQRVLHLSKQSILLPGHSGIQAYLDQIGFPLGAVSPTDQYDNHLPLCQLNTDSEEKAIEIVGNKMSDLISEHIGQEYDVSTTAVQYPMSELIDNVDQHSQCSSGALLIQHYPSKSELDICVADDGITIPGSYENSDIGFEDDEAALMKAVSGTSTKPNSGNQRGFGIPSTVEMVCEGLNGEVLLASRGAAIHRRGDEPFSRIEGVQWPGTVFVARMEPPDRSFPWHRYTG